MDLPLADVGTVPLLPPEKVQENAALLRTLASQYIWWMHPEEALGFPARIVAQVMNIGVFEDVRRLHETLGDDILRRIVTGAEAGWFNERSWHFWHYRLNLAVLDQVPPLPVRQIG